MTIFKIEGTLTFSLQVEARDETRARELVDKNLEVTVGDVARHKGWDPKEEYMEVIDSNWVNDDLEVEQLEDE